MKYYLISFIFLCVMAMSAVSGAQVIAGSPSYIQVSVTTNTTTLSYDSTRLDWQIHPNGGNIRCVPGLVNGQPNSTVPSTTIGYEFVAGVYLTNYSSPTVSLNCTAESGTVIVDLWIDTRAQ